MAETLSIKDALRLGLRYYEAGELQKAEKLYRQVLEVSPENADALNLLGILAYRVNKLDVAEGLILRSLSLSPDNVCANFYLGRVQQSSQKYDKAIASYKQTLSLDCNHIDAYINMGNVYHAGSNYAMAIACYNDALNVNPECVGALVSRGNVHYDCNEYEEALASHRKALNLAPENYGAYVGIANVFCKMDDLQQALTHCQKAVQLGPQAIEPYIALGNVLKQDGQFNDAVLAYRKALEISPDHPGVLNNIGYALYLDGQSEEAVSYFEEAKKVHPAYNGTYCNLGMALVTLGKLDAAVVNYKIALKNLIQMHQAKLSISVDRRVMSNERAHEAFKDFSVVMQKNNLEFFLCFGTLLGCIRESNFLSFDKDIDVGIFEGGVFSRMLDAFRCADRFMVCDEENINQQSKTFSVRHKNSVSIDVFIHRQDGGKYLVGIDNPAEDFDWQFSKFALIKREFLEGEVLIPDDFELYLSEVYGDWKVSDPFFDSLVSAHNIARKGSKLSLCYALSRVYNSVSEGDYEKALALCIKAQKVFPAEEVLQDVKLFLT